MSVYLKDSSVLLDDSGNVATSSDCCCGGVCCKCDDTCDNATDQETCESEGGTWYPSATCEDDPDPCTTTPTGSCCNAGVCSENVTQACCENDGGTYGGDDSTCATGACCRGTDCTIEDQCSCEYDGGIYQGDDTVCDPNPCEECQECCGATFTGFLGTHTYRTQSVHYVLNDVGGSVCTGTRDGIKFTDHTCEGDIFTCSGECTYDDIFGTHQSGSYTDDGSHTNCVWDCGLCVGCIVGSPTIVSDSVQIQECHYNDGTSTSDLVVTTTLSNPCCV